MSIFKETESPILMNLRKGNTDDPYVLVIETNKQSSPTGIIQLGEIPVNASFSEYVKQYLGSDFIFDATAKTITSTAVDFTAFADGDKLTILGSLYNDGSYTINGTPTTNVITLIAADTLVNETASTLIMIARTITGHAIELYDESDNLMTEIVDNTHVLGTNEYRVDYEYGTIFVEAGSVRDFNKVEYMGRGAFYIPASRIYDDNFEGTLVTLEEILANINSANPLHNTLVGLNPVDAQVVATDTILEAFGKLAYSQPLDIAHRNSDGKSHSDVVQNNFYRADGEHTTIIERRTDDPVLPAIGRMWVRTDL